MGLFGNLNKWWNKGYTPAEKSMSLWDLIKDDAKQITKSDEAFKKYGQKGVRGWNPAKAFSPKMVSTGPTPLVRYALPRMGMLASALAPSDSIMSNKDEMAVVDKWNAQQVNLTPPRIKVDLFSPRKSIGPKKAKSIAQREEEVYFELKLAGFDDKAIAAIMGNMRQENSNFDPNLVNSIGAKGMFQMLPGKGLLDEYQAYLGGEADSSQNQIDYVYDTIYGTNKADIGAGNAKYLRTGFTDLSLEDATSLFSDLWERPAPWEAENDKRKAYAKSYYKDILKQYD